MSVSNSRTVVHPLVPAIGSNVSLTKFSAVSIPPVAELPLSLQVRSKKKKLAEQETVTNITRREIMHFAAASFGAIALFLAQPSEARVRKPENRRKIMEKLEMERKKAGVSKKPTTEPPKGAEPSIPIFPDLQKTLAESMVEATMSDKENQP